MKFILVNNALSILQIILVSNLAMMLNDVRDGERHANYTGCNFVLLISILAATGIYLAKLQACSRRLCSCTFSFRCEDVLYSKGVIRQ
jgi:hypothetical protein